MSPLPTLVVFSHLRWNFVYQRPQHVLTRFASNRKVLYIEEPVRDSDNSVSWEFSNPAPGVTVCRPHTPLESGGFSDDQNSLLEPMVCKLISERAGNDYDVWLYTPMAWPLAAGLQPRRLVYDKMDDLASFKAAPLALRDREEALLARADVVFTGGASLYQATKDRHTNCHCFPSSVDANHFGRAATPLPEPREQAAIPRPRLGYFGVIDERFDTALLAAAATTRPTWQFVLVGPVVKIDPRDLPQAPNIHYLGQKTYEELPAFLAGWDVALLPFARNEATRFISPTKTLEYMAAGKPIVSTPIADVAEQYGAMVGLGETVSDFIAACDRALAETTADRDRRLAQFAGVLARTSWDSTVGAMAKLLEATGAKAPPTVPRIAATLLSRKFKNPPVVVIGAGPTGLSAAYHLGHEALLLEANSTVGGWCRSLQDNGFTFDMAGHIMFSNDPYVHEMYRLLLGDNVHWQDREAWIYSKEVYTRYPFQGSLYGLPADVIKECIVGAIESRYGSLKKTAAKPPLSGQANGVVKPTANGVANRMATSKSPCDDPKDRMTDCCADGAARPPLSADVQDRSDETRTSTLSEREPRNFEEFIYQVWGAGIAKHFAIPYNQKIWAVPLQQMETSWLGGRVPMPDLGEMIEGALSPTPKPMGPNARFGYPLRGGFQALMDGFLPILQGELRLDTRVKSISSSRRTVTHSDGVVIPYEHLVSTMPLPSLIRAMGDSVPDAVRTAAAALRYTSVRCVNLGVGRENLTAKHWIYYPEETVFHRIFVQGNASPHCNPPGGFGLTCEITYGPLKPLPCDGEELVRRCIDDCVKVGIMRADDAILAANQVDMPFAYVVYDHARLKNVALIRSWLSEYDIHLAGRYSEWEYYNSDHAFLAGKKVADAIRARIAIGATSRV